MAFRFSERIWWHLKSRETGEIVARADFIDPGKDQRDTTGIDTNEAGVKHFQSRLNVLEPRV
jgi:hypothetical protein